MNFTHPQAPCNRIDLLLNKANFVVCAILFCLFIFYPSLVKADGVTAGTIIQNLAVVSYNVGASPQQPIESTPGGNSNAGLGNGQATVFIVDRKIDLLVTGNTNANVSPGDTQAQVTFSLQNQGNSIQEFNLISDSLLTSDNYDVNNCNVEVTAVTGTPLPGVILPTTGNILLSPDQIATVSIKCDVPPSNSGAPILTGQTALVELLATAVKNSDGSNTIESTNSDTPSTIETVFADGAGTDDATRDASYSAVRTYVATTSSAPPELTMDKTVVSVTDPSGGSTAITGSEVIYKIQVSTTGIGTIENLIITDPTPVGTSYKLNSIQLNNTNQTDLSDAVDNTDFGITTADTATINLGNFAAGNQYEILVTYIIN